MGGVIVADKQGFEWGTGRRKTAIARVRLGKGAGKITVNGRDHTAYFPNRRLCKLVEGPLKHLNVEGQYDVFVNVRGGGVMGQAGAVMMGLGRALLKVSPDWKSSLSGEGYLSRDSRMVERKKPGKPGARRSFQFSKR